MHPGPPSCATVERGLVPWPWNHLKRTRKGKMVGISRSNPELSDLLISRSKKSILKIYILIDYPSLTDYITIKVLRSRLVRSLGRRKNFLTAKITAY